MFNHSKGLKTYSFRYYFSGGYNETNISAKTKKAAINKFKRIYKNVKHYTVKIYS